MAAWALALATITAVPGGGKGSASSTHGSNEIRSYSYLCLKNGETVATAMVALRRSNIPTQAGAAGPSLPLRGGWDGGSGSAYPL